MKSKAQLILISSKMVLYHAHDLLDLRFLQTGNFTPSYAEHSLPDAVLEIVHLIRQTLEGKSLKVECQMSK